MTRTPLFGSEPLILPNSRRQWNTCAKNFWEPYYVFVRLIAGDALRESPFLAIEPSALKVGMREMGELERGLADDFKFLTSDDCAMIELQSLAIAKLANDLKVNVPNAVAKSSREDWTKLLDATIDRARKLATAAADPEKAEDPKVSQAYRDLTETCLVCHTAFGVK